MNEDETRQETAAKIFANDWHEGGRENSDYQDFWREFLHDIFGVERPRQLIEFQKPVGGGKHIDAYIAKTKVLIEHKSFGVSLDQKIRQSDGEYLTPFEQAMRYVDALPASEKPRWIITCNFAEFRIYDTKKNLFEREPTVISLRELRYHYKRFKFLIDPNADDKPPEEKITKDAAKIVEQICKAFDENYRRREPAFVELLRKFCMRLVFCFYADDGTTFAQIKFDDYLQNIPTEKFRDTIQKVFDVLNTPEDERDDFNDTLKKFPYVDGGLFDEKLDIPPLNEYLQLAIIHAHHIKIAPGHFLTDEDGKFVKFSWREISPPIFGATFESLFKPDVQREGGMYYTDEDNIRKVIKPLFLDALRDEFDAIKRRHIQNRPQGFFDLQDKLASLKFLDPACGSGNFLTMTYKALRQLENEIIEELRGLNVTLPADPIKVSINQFYGIEIQPFAAAVAQVAMYIAENQMLQQTEGVIGKDLQAFPLKDKAHITIDNALQIDWHSVAPAVNFIIGNPPFVGARMKSAAQAADMQRVSDGWDNTANLDYVTCWYKKAVDFIKGTNIRCAFVSTNSVCQGDQVGALWKNLFAAGVHIDFAYRTFKWLSDSDNPAHVHCVIVGFSVAPNAKQKIIFDGGKGRVAKNINAYLVDGENIFVESRNEPLQDGVPEIGIGNKPIDDGNYLFTPAEMEDFIKHEPAAAKYFHPWYGAQEFIKGIKRYCLWLGDLTFDEIKQMPLCWERVLNVAAYRLASKSKPTRKIAETPTRFHVENFPRGNFIAIPKTSSERRFYIPIGFMNDSVICADSLRLVASAQIYHFGVLTSSIHMAWTRATCGRLKSDYSYSNYVVYNTFPWPEPMPSQRRAIERSAQEILDVRAGFEGWTFARLYNPETMPQPLHDAHKLNDTAVALAYGFESILYDEAAVVAELMKLYRRLTS